MLIHRKDFFTYLFKVNYFYVVYYNIIITNVKLFLQKIIWKEILHMDQGMTRADVLTISFKFSWGLAENPKPSPACSA